MTKIYSALLLSLLFLSACKSASKAYDKGDYNNAIELAIKKLQKDPNDEETKFILKNAYLFAVNSHEDRIRILSKSSSNARYEQIYGEYRQLQNLYQTLQQYPSLTSFVKPNDYSDYVETFKDKAADVHYQNGLTWMNEGRKEDFRKAYHAFKTALNYKTDDENIRRKMEEAYKLAVVNVIVSPMNEYGGTGSYRYTSSYQMRNFENDVLRNLRSHVNNEFVKFYTLSDARTRQIEPDEILEMRLGQMDIGRPYDELKTRIVSKEVVVKETVYKPDSVVKQYAKVQAEITQTCRTLLSDGELYVTARDPKGRIIWNDIFRGEHKWQVNFAAYKGDERALSESDRTLLNTTTSYNPPREEEISEAVLERIENDMRYRIRNQYNRYN